MGLLSNLEQRLDRIVNGGFSRAFKSEVSPVELAAALQQEIDLQAKLINGRTVAPNVFVFELSLIDRERLSPYFGTLRSELVAVAKSYILDQRYVVVGQLSVDFGTDEVLETGEFRIRSDAADGTRSLHDTVSPEHASPQVPSEMASRAATPRLTAVNGQEFTLTQPIMTIGRGEAATIQINEPGASRVHCEVILGSQTLVRDLGSTNGTVVDGVRVVEGILKEGSIIRIGDTTLTYTSR